MSVRVLYGTDGEQVMYDSVSMVAFGPVFRDKSADYGLDGFIAWLEDKYRTDALCFSTTDRLGFDRSYREWMKEMRKEKA